LPFSHTARHSIGGQSFDATQMSPYKSPGEFQKKHCFEGKSLEAYVANVARKPELNKLNSASQFNEHQLKIALYKNRELHTRNVSLLSQQQEGNEPHDQINNITKTYQQHKANVLHE
jgi:hypothetical protein